jgi:hypothetical protein
VTMDKHNFVVELDQLHRDRFVSRLPSLSRLPACSHGAPKAHHQGKLPSVSWLLPPAARVATSEHRIYPSQETERLLSDSPPGISAIPHEDNLRYFDVIISGPESSPFEGASCVPVTLPATVSL